MSELERSPSCLIKSQKGTKERKVHSHFQGVIMTPVGGVNLTPYSGAILGGSYFNSKKEFKELFLRSENHPRY